MAEKKSKPANAGYDTDNQVGQIQISEHVVAMIAGIAATEIEGVDSLVGNITTELVSMMGIKNLSKGVRVQMFEDSVAIDLTLNLLYGINIPETCAKVQEKVSSTVETMTGLSVLEVNVNVVDLSMN